MIRPILGDNEKNANANIFKKIFIGNAVTKFSIHAQSSTITSGVPTWTLRVCNFDGTLTDFPTLSTETTNMAINSPVECSQCLFEYLAVEYTSNGATGEVQFYFSNDL